MLNLRCMALRIISVCDIVCNIEALEKLRFKMIMKCLKRVKIFGCPVLPYSFPPMDCSDMKTVRKTIFKFRFPIINILIIKQAIGL